ncbi:ATP synthase subunit b [Planctomycetes bacterium Pan216]|uniref:ATP synthase subunit b n=1 Tax=Kolteria novifilia TaxID=2527975 RepID=A0A518B8C0_9BACT|nr:ATP synthase subunit b [Planctomycetes bacterium Pan216]
MLFASSGGGDYLLALDLALWSGVVFVILACLLGSTAVNPILDALKRRQTQTEASLHQAELAEAETKRLMAELRRRQALARDEAAELLAEAQLDAEQMHKEFLERAQAEADRMSNRSQREIRLAEQAAIAELWGTTASLATETAEKILQAKLSHDDQRRLIAEAITDIGQSEGRVA